jgi:hypothetical protein
MDKLQVTIDGVLVQTQYAHTFYRGVEGYIRSTSARVTPDGERHPSYDLTIAPIGLAKELGFASVFHSKCSEDINEAIAEFKNVVDMAIDYAALPESEKS